jgi:hypothetical protein
MTNWEAVFGPGVVATLLIVFGWSMGWQGWRRYKRDMPPDVVDVSGQIRALTSLRVGYLATVDFVAEDGRQRSVNVSVIDAIGRSVAVGQKHTIAWCPSQPDLAYFGSQNTVKTQNALGLAMAAMGGLLGLIGISFLIYIVTAPPQKSGFLPPGRPRPPITIPAPP